MIDKETIVNFVLKYVSKPRLQMPQGKCVDTEPESTHMQLKKSSVLFL